MHFDNIHPTPPSQFLAISFAGSLSLLDFCTSEESGASLSTLCAVPDASEPFSC